MKTRMSSSVPPVPSILLLTLQEGPDGHPPPPPADGRLGPTHNLIVFAQQQLNLLHFSGSRRGIDLNSASRAEPHVLSGQEASEDRREDGVSLGAGDWMLQTTIISLTPEVTKSSPSGLWCDCC